MDENLKWVKPGAGAQNLILDCGGFYISFNDGAMLNMRGNPETALIIPLEDTYKILPDSPERPNKCFAILEGDFRREYEEAAPDLEACKNVFRKYCETYEGFWSDGLPEDGEG